MAVVVAGTQGGATALLYPVVVSEGKRVVFFFVFFSEIKYGMS